ncbi:hypothetical protein Tco_0509428 [Tanacetum coccineum]
MCDNVVFQTDDCDAFDSDVDEAPTAQTMFMANLSSADPVYDEAGPSYDSDILSEVHDHDHYQDAVCEHHEEHEMHDDVQPNYVVDSHADYTSNSNMIPYDQYVKDNTVPVVQSNVSSVTNDAYMMIYNDMCEPHAQSVSKTTQNIVVDNSLTVELETYKEQVELYERRARFELTEREQKIDEQLRIVITDRNIKEENLKKELHSVKLQLASTSTITRSDIIKMKAEALKEQTTTLRPIKALIVYPAKIQPDKRMSLGCIRQHKDQVKPKVLAPGKYAIDVEPIPPRNKNNREVHLVYLKHLKESVETLREIVEEAKAERPLDRSLASACRYTKHSQELLEYVIGTCPKALNTRDNKHASTSLPKKKQVTFEEQCAMSKSNTHKPVKQLNCQKTNVPVPPSTGVNSCTDASGSQPRSNTKKNRILPAKSVNMKKVEEHPRTIKSSLKTTNRVDSSISSKHTGSLVDTEISVKKSSGMVKIFGNDHFGAYHWIMETTLLVDSNFFIKNSSEELHNPPQNVIDERQPYTLFEAARTLLILNSTASDFSMGRSCATPRIKFKSNSTRTSLHLQPLIKMHRSLNSLHRQLCSLQTQAYIKALQAESTLMEDIPFASY